ncbi:potassium channel family protein [Geomonas sp. RF6]|uniref:potassium channel family protein n=1 Tax=Geomonas sp. RF6 TaxID=2897342 RepID=UPI001E4AF1A9|nr:potassium channel family protein [Geomonas sp. RF6]UFS70656.1 potassium channel family protein [Geomonas sp. RF6]
MKGAVKGICSSFWGRFLGEEGLSIFLLFLFLSLLLGPFLDRLPSRPINSLVFTLVMVAGVAKISRCVELRFLAGGAALVAIMLRWLTHLIPSPALERWSSWASLIFMAVLTCVVLMQVFMEERQVTAHLIRGAIAAYLLFGITWSILYTLLDQTIPGAFTMNVPAGAERQERFVYFSFVTLTTVGYGDITPSHDISRMFAVAEALVGQLYPATLLARLVSLEASHEERGGSRVPWDGDGKGGEGC